MATYVKGKSLAPLPDASYQRMLKAGLPTGGIDVFDRSFEQQKKLRAAYLRDPKRNPVAAPASLSAPHIRRYAMDAQTTRSGKYSPSAAHKWMATGTRGDLPPRSCPGERPRGREYGWVRSVPSERWHWQYYLELDKVLWRIVQKALGGLTVDGIPGAKTIAKLKAWQKKNKLTADGVPGEKTMTKLQAAPKPTPTPPAAVDFRVAAYNVQLKRFGGGTYSADATYIKDVLAPSILMAQEAEESARDAIRSKGVLRKVWPLGTTALMWDDRKYSAGGRIELRLGTAYHGLIGTELTRLANGSKLVAASVHIRPNDAIPGTTEQKTAGKLKDVAKIITALAKYPNVVVGGDWATSHARALLEKAGYRLVTPWADTYDKAGVQRLDQIYIRGPLLLARTGGSVHPTPASDHHGVVANLTIKA